MGNREDLIDGATRSLYEKGYSRTTARDIASASGVSLAAIGYHFGTKEALLHAALYREMERWGDDLATAAGKKIEPGMSPTERFEAIWTGVIESFTAHRRLWMLQFELLGHLDSLPELRKNLVASTADAREGWSNCSVTRASSRAGHTHWALSTRRCCSASRSSGWWIPTTRCPPRNCSRRCGRCRHTWPETTEGNLPQEVPFTLVRKIRPCRARLP